MKTKRKIMWLDLWQIEEQEAWLSDLASKGWKLKKMNKLTATFTKSSPQTVDFRADIIKESVFEDQERLDLYEQAGWEYVNSRSHLHFFRSIPERTIQEIHTDQIKQTETVSVLKRDLKARASILFFLSLIIITLSFFMLTANPVHNYLQDDFLPPLIMILTFLLINLLMWRGIIHLKKLVWKLEENRPLNHQADYRRKYWINKTVGLAVIAVFSLFFIYEWVEAANTSMASGYPPIPKEQLPVVQLADFLENEAYEPFQYNDNMNLENYYSFNSSILVPEQYELNQLVEVEGELWEDGSGPYRPSLTSRKYVVQNEWLAQNLMQHLLEEQKEFFRGALTHQNDSEYDELYILEESFIARKDNMIYHVIYFGKESMEVIIKTSHSKLKD
ncbi:hypothetical protein AB685_01710 [Bacillus sp. LL01]|uniref:DUF2812 domain-containing protein n=1 Tax=Bacillus sp. LL01 TaxID=1665556 RepID=UPI00064D12E8|nr:DUF2812 domain-containing protein [Bacillus sp. LL01]KMJ59617.1 hypothetical protein AB685_01710 [Bacillus sp. LL01]